MGISAVSSITSVGSLTAQAALKTAGTTKTAGGGGKTSGATASASTASGTSSASDNSKIYDKRDTNQDGTVSYMEAMQYAFQHPGEVDNSEAAAQSYSQRGKAARAMAGAASIIDLSA